MFIAVQSDYDSFDILLCWWGIRYWCLGEGKAHAWMVRAVDSFVVER